jgi:hypothetical protein
MVAVTAILATHQPGFSRGVACLIGLGGALLFLALWRLRKRRRRW